MRKKLILHDLSPADAEKFLPVASEEYILFSAAPPVHGCVGCFGCWIKTPGRCVIADRGVDFVGPLSLCDEFIVISRMTFGGLSPDVKAVLDRSIGIVMPFFRYINGETHHTKRYGKIPRLRYLFYGQNMTESEKATAGKLAVANQINLGFGNPSAEFYTTACECAGALNARDAETLRPDADSPGGAHVIETGSSHEDGNRNTASQTDAGGSADAARSIGATGSSRANGSSDTEEQTSAGAPGDARARSKIALINGSPKQRGSASKLILEALRERIGEAADCVVVNAAKQERGELIRAVGGCDAIVFVFPLYVDGIPSHLLRLLDEASDEIADAAPGATVYAVVNNGFYEGRQNALVFEMMKHFANRTGLAWGGGIGVGAGGMVHALTVGHGPLKKLGVALDSLAQNVTNCATADNYTFEPAFPRFLYKAAAHSEWRTTARKNGLTVKQLYKK
jgi:multimeric flavodoxin WrbA